MNIGINDLEKTLGNLLDDYNQEIQDAVDVSIEKTAKDAAKKLKQGGEYDERTGRYTKGWRVDFKKGTIVNGSTATVYNAKMAGLAHLLEFGHLTSKGRRTKEFTHITPVNNDVGDNVEKELRKIL